MRRVPGASRAAAPTCEGLDPRAFEESRRAVAAVVVVVVHLLGVGRAGVPTDPHGDVRGHADLRANRRRQGQTPRSRRPPPGSSGGAGTHGRRTSPRSPNPPRSAGRRRTSHRVRKTPFSDAPPTARAPGSNNIWHLREPALTALAQAFALRQRSAPRVKPTTAMFDAGCSETRLRGGRAFCVREEDGGSSLPLVLGRGYPTAAHGRESNALTIRPPRSGHSRQW